MPHPKGGYRNRDGKKVPGVTTIIGRFKDSGGLLYWAFEQGQLAERGLISSLYDKRDAAADAGTLAHALVEAYIKGEPQPFIPDNDVGRQAKQGFENFLAWLKNSKIEIVEQEVEMVSEEHQFGGCLDAVGIDGDKKRCLLDWKTGSHVFVDFLLQLGGYRILWDEKYPDKPFDGGFHLIRFSKDDADFAHYHWSELDLAKEQFLLLRKAYENDKILKKRV